MFCSVTPSLGLILLLCNFLLGIYPVLSCAGTRIPRKTLSENGYGSHQDDVSDSIPKSFWISPKCDPIYDLTLLIVCGCISVVFSALLAEFVVYHLFRTSISGREPVLSQIASVMGWLILVILAPFLYWPELGPIYQEVMITQEMRRSSSPKSPSNKSPATSPRTQRSVYVQTSGPSNKKVLRQATEYNMTVKGCRHERTAKLKKTANMLLQFRTKWKYYLDEMYCRDKVTEDALAETVRLERQVVFLHDACASLREQLKTQQTVNKGVLQRYRDIHQQVLGYLGTDVSLQTHRHRQPDSSSV